MLAYDWCLSHLLAAGTSQRYKKLLWQRCANPGIDWLKNSFSMLA